MYTQQCSKMLNRLLNRDDNTFLMRNRYSFQLVRFSKDLLLYSGRIVRIFCQDSGKPAMYLEFQVGVWNSGLYTHYDFFSHTFLPLWCFSLENPIPILLKSFILVYFRSSKCKILFNLCCEDILWWTFWNPSFILLYFRSSKFKNFFNQCEYFLW